MIDWLLAAAIALLIAVCAVQEHQITTMGRRYVKLEEWAEDWLKSIEQKYEKQTDRIAKLLVKIADMSDDYKEMAEKLDAFEELIPKDGKGELVRNQLLLQQMNDEMEKSLKMEKDFNEGLQNILKYGETKRGE